MFLSDLLRIIDTSFVQMFGPPTEIPSVCGKAVGRKATLDPQMPQIISHRSIKIMG